MAVARLFRPPDQQRRALRRSTTDAEKLLWSSLRDGQVGGVEFRRQFSVGSYVLDFYAPAYRVAVEVDDSQHLTAEGISADAKRTAFLERVGIRVVRFTNVEVLQELPSVLDTVTRLERRDACC
jgi:very-short-patch-repair endonuclease